MSRTLILQQHSFQGASKVVIPFLIPTHLLKSNSNSSSSAFLDKMPSAIDEDARRLVHTIASQISTKQGFGSFSPAVYDTAWVSMIEKPSQNGSASPLFPQYLEYLKSTRLSDGLWASQTSQDDAIINSLAALSL
jgi:hypothetical protein